MICDFAVNADDTTLCAKCDFRNLNLIYKTLWIGVRSDLLISMLAKLNWFHLTRQITMVLLM